MEHHRILGHATTLGAYKRSGPTLGVGWQQRTLASVEVRTRGIAMVSSVCRCPTVFSSHRYCIVDRAEIADTFLLPALAQDLGLG